MSIENCLIFSIKQTCGRKMYSVFNGCYLINSAPLIVTLEQLLSKSEQNRPISHQINVSKAKKKQAIFFKFSHFIF